MIHDHRFFWTFLAGELTGIFLLLFSQVLVGIYRALTDETPTPDCDPSEDHNSRHYVSEDE